MDDKQIDYEALAKAIWDRDYHGEIPWNTAIKSGVAIQRLQNVVSVVTALRAQGMVMVRADDLKAAEPFIMYALESCSRSPLRADGLRALRAFRAALVAAPVMVEEN